MRVRSGFVSNSSSSSFIVGFEKIPQSVEEMQAVLFPDGDHRLGRKYFSDVGHWTAERVAERVFQDMTREADEWHEGSQASLHEVAEELGLYDVKEKMEKFPFEKVAEVSKQYLGEDLAAAKLFILDDWYCSIMREFEDILAERFPSLVGLELRYFSYSDEDGEGILEQGGTFDNVPHVTISHH